MKIIILIALFILSTSKDYAQEKPSIIVLTDIGGDPDDEQSLVRFLLYANDYQIEAICATSRMSHGKEVHPEIITNTIRAYGKVYNNLIKNASGFPTPEYLQSVVYVGLGDYTLLGEGHNTAASDQIIKTVDVSDKIVNILIWGGQRELAQALWKVRNTQSEEKIESFCRKIRVYAIGDQDGHRAWILKNFPNINYVAMGYAGLRKASTYRGMYLTGDTGLQNRKWVRANVYGHGALGACYPLDGGGVPGMKEGDTPSFLLFIENGLNFPEQPEWGGWGGRYRQVKDNTYVDAPDVLDGNMNERHSVSKWRPAYQRDFMARLDWCVKPYDEANHNPTVIVNGSAGYAPLHVDAKRGDVLQLNAEGSIDPDEDSLSYHWFVYDEISGTQGQCLQLEATNGKCTFRVPEALDNTIHLILAVEDNGTPSLTTYKRIVIHIADSDKIKEN